MTTYTAITNGQIDQDSPITQPLMTALRDNPIAITEGATGAPRILGLAAATIEEVPVLTVSAADTYSIGAAEGLVTGIIQTQSSSYVTAYTINVESITGSARFKASHRNLISGGNTVDLRLLKNGSVVASWTTSSTTSVERSADVSVVSGDILIWEHKVTSSGAVSFVSPQSTTATNGYAEAPLLIAESDV